MNNTNALTEDEAHKLLIVGLSRSLEMLEELILGHVDPTALATDFERDLLNRVKERRNTGENPIAIYLRPFAKPNQQNTTGQSLSKDNEGH